MLNIEEQGRERRIKGIAMAQWVNHLRNNIFVNPLPLPLLCEISGALQVNFKIFKVGCRSKYLTCRFNLIKVQHHYSLTYAFQLVFSSKTHCKVDFYSSKCSGSHMISYQSLLLSTNILNDISQVRLALSFGHLYNNFGMKKVAK